MRVMRRPYDAMIRHLEQEFERHGDVAKRLIRAAAPADGYWEPAADVYETEGALHIKVELAGVHPSDLQVFLSADARALVIRGVRRDTGDDEPRVRYYQMEIFSGAFQRIIPLPSQFIPDRESVQACYRDGFLLVKLPPRAEPPVVMVLVTE